MAMSRSGVTAVSSPHYDLVDLRVFLAIAEEGNLSRGAQRVNLAPSSVSLRLKGLEDAVGTALFERQARGVTLTRAGAVMLDHVRRCMAGLEQMHVDLMPYVHGLSTQLTVLANNNVINSYLPQDLARVFKQHPSVRITLEERLGSEIVAAVAAGRADVGIVAVDADHPDLTFIPYRDDEFVVLVPAGSPLASRQAVRFVQCLGKPFISLQNGTALHTYLMNQASAAGGRLDVRVQVSSYQAVTQLVASGAGIGIVPRSALSRRSAGVEVLELKESWATRHHRICVRTQVYQDNAFLRSLADCLCGHG